MTSHPLMLLVAALAGTAYAQQGTTTVSVAPVSEAWWAVVGMGGVLIIAWGITRLIAHPLLAHLRTPAHIGVAVDPAGPPPEEPAPSVIIPGAGPEPELVLVAGDVRVELLARRAMVGDQQIDLTSTEFDLLRYLLAHQGQALSRADLLREVWGHQQLVYSRTVDTHVQRLRDKLGSSREQLETVRGVGYRLNGPVVV